MLRAILVGWSLIVMVMIVAGRSGSAEAAGPWKAQVVDAETGQLLEGAVVLAIWHRRYTSPGGWAGGGYYASEEVVTGADGHFVIQARSTFTFLPFLTVIKGPEFIIFKPGYGRWRWLGSDAWPQDAYERKRRADAVREQFMGEGVVIELPPLKTREERIKGMPSLPGDVPASRMTKLLEVVDRERVFLGFKPLRRTPSENQQ